jgi:tetratricopeptide (TPR) repeat protein
MCTTKRANCCKLIDVLVRFTRRPRRLSWFGLAMVLALGSSGARPARADTPSAEAIADARLGEAKKKFEEGVRAYGERRYADAVTAFRQADAIEPSAALSFNIARAYERLDDASAALRWYRDYLRRNPQAANVTEVKARVDELALSLEARGVQQISVLAKPSGASVLIDDRVAGVAPFTTELAPGKHRLSVRANGYRDHEADFVLEPRAPRDLSVTLEPLSATAAPAGVAPTLAAPLAPATSPRPASAPPQAKPFGIAPWIVLGAGAASSLGALGFELARRSAESDAKAADQLGYSQHFEAMESRQTASRVLAVVGGALLISGGALLILNTSRQPASGVALGCSGNGCGVSASGSFQ